MRKFLTKITEPAKTKLLQLNKQLASLVRSRHFQDALHLFDEIHSSSSSPHIHLKPDEYTLSAGLTACANLRNAAFGSKLHAHAVKSGLKSHLHVSNTLLLVYARARDAFSMKRVFGEIEYPDAFSYATVLSECAKSGDLEYAFQVFDEMPAKDVSAWNAMITGCVESGNEGVGFLVFRDMHRLGVSPDNYSFGSVLSGCCLEKAEFGRQVHSLVIRTGSMAGTSIVNALLTMYFSYEEVGNAVLVFEEVEDEVHNHISYNVMIGGLQSAGMVDKAILMFKKMLACWLSPSELSFVSLVSSCYHTTIGSQVHSQVFKRGFEAHTVVSNSMITMYANFKDMVSAYMIFDSQRAKDDVSWNAIISGYSQWNCGRSAISSYIEMQKAELKPDEFTFGSLLASSDSLRTLEMIHSNVFKAGLVSSIQVSNSLISAYCKHGNVEEGQKVFLSMLSRSLVSWNTIMSGFSLNGFHIQGLEHFSQLLTSGYCFLPNEHTLTIGLSICASISASEQAKQIHAYILRFNSSPRGSLGNALITTYSKCGLLDWSSRVFSTMSEKDVVSWNALMSAYAQHGEANDALKCLDEMSDSFEVSPDQATFAAVLSACSHAGLVDEGARVLNSMVDRYGIKPGVDHFACVIDLLGRAGYFSQVEEIIQREDFEAHPNIWWSLISTCATHGNLELGRRVAGYLLETERHNSSAYVMLANIYAGTGQWEEAANVRREMDTFGRMKQPGYSWICR